MNRLFHLCREKHRIRRGCPHGARGALTACLAAFALLCVAGCSRKQVQPEEETEDPKLTVVGFSQLGAESDWRSANSESMRSRFTEENGYRLIFEDGQQKQANQIKAIRTFIQREVDYIVLAPVTETGWDTVLEEARTAGIPVILVDRRVDVSDDKLFTCWAGSDFALEGEKAVCWLEQYTEAKGLAPEDLHIVNIQGTIGASAQIGRTGALRRGAKRCGWDLLEEVSGEFTQTKGREVMEMLLSKYDNINVVYCENDNEALGAIEAIEAAGRTAGPDIAGGEIMIISFDGVGAEALEDVRQGKISCIAECNPIQGPLVADIIGQLKAGETPDKYSYIEEGIFAADDTVTELTIKGTTYPVTVLAGQP